MIHQLKKKTGFWLVSRFAQLSHFVPTHAKTISSCGDDVNVHCVKSVHIRSFSGPYSFRIWGKYGPEKL